MTCRILARTLTFAALLAVLCVGFGAASPGPGTASASGAVVQGDVNCSGAVDARDSLQILLGVASSASSPPACGDDAADVDCDGNDDADDAILILRYLASALSEELLDCVPVGDFLVRPPSSEELIAIALGGGDITYEESLLYRAQALYNVPELPDEFRSAVIDYEAAIPLFAEIEANRSQLSQGLQDQLAPFMARPNDPISIFNNPPVAQTAPAGPVPAWRSRVVQFTNARVWIKATSDARLSVYEVAVAKVWPKLDQVFGLPTPDAVASPPDVINPDTRIDIYFQSTGEVDPRALGCTNACNLSGANGMAKSIDMTGNKASGFIMIRDSLTGDYLLKVIAHELAHTVQFKYDYQEDFWLMDATADWAGFRVLQELGARGRGNLYTRAKIVIDQYDQPLSRDVGETRYAAWLYFFFASMERGDGIVTTIWQKAAAPGKQRERAADEVFPFDDFFDNFTVRNWNQDPVDPLYRSPPPGDMTYPPGLIPEIPASRDHKLEGTTIETVQAALAPLAALYYRYTFGSTVRNVDFYPLLQGNPHAHIWAIVKANGQWKAPEDWSTKSSASYCRDIPAENVSEVIIILSNSGMNDDLPGGPKLHVEVGETGCNGYVGWFRATVHEIDDSQDMTYTTQQVPVRFKVSKVGPGYVDYGLVDPSGPVGWDAHGTIGDCTADGEASVPLPGGPFDPVSPLPGGYLHVVGTGGGDWHGGLIQAFDPTQTFTVTCPGDPVYTYEQSFRAAYLWLVVMAPNTHDGNATILKGHYDFVPPCPPPAPSCPPQTIFQTFDWELNPVGVVPPP